MGVALTASILAACAAITALLAEHYANEAMFEQIQCANQWNRFQSKGIKAEVLDMKIELWEELGHKVTQKDLDHAKKYEADKEEIKTLAEELQEASKKHLARHEAMAPGLTMFQLAIAIGAISVLTREKAFWLVSIAFGVVGVCFVAAGFIFS